MRARATILLILSLAGGAGFLASVIALNLGFTAMWARYALAGFVAYLAFLLLVRLWITRHRRLRDREIPDLDAGLFAPRSRTAPDFQVGGGGRSGGAGASGSWGSPRGSSLLDGATGPWDLDDSWPVAVVIFLAFGGVIAIVYVIYIAPVLLAELAVDAAMISAAYGKLRGQGLPPRGGLIRRTWLPAAAMVFSLAVAGWILQALAPDARSIGGVVAALRD